MEENVYLPKMGQTMTEGTVEKWIKKNGDLVKKGEEIVEITTDKITTAIESPEEGVLKIMVQQDETVPVGTVIGKISL